MPHPRLTLGWLLEHDILWPFLGLAFDVVFGLLIGLNGPDVIADGLKPSGNMLRLEDNIGVNRRTDT